MKVMCASNARTLVWQRRRRGSSDWATAAPLLLFLLVMVTELGTTRALRCACGGESLKGRLLDTGKGAKCVNGTCEVHPIWDGDDNDQSMRTVVREAACVLVQSEDARSLVHTCLHAPPEKRRAEPDPTCRVHRGGRIVVCHCFHHDMCNLQLTELLADIGDVPEDDAQSETMASTTTSLLWETVEDNSQAEDDESDRSLLTDDVDDRPAKRASSRDESPATTAAAVADSADESIVVLDEYGSDEEEEDDDDDDYDDDDAGYHRRRNYADDKDDERMAMTHQIKGHSHKEQQHRRPPAAAENEDKPWRRVEPVRVKQQPADEGAPKVLGATIDRPVVQADLLEKSAAIHGAPSVIRHDMQMPPLHPASSHLAHPVLFSVDTASSEAPPIRTTTSSSVGTTQKSSITTRQKGHFHSDLEEQQHKSRLEAARRLLLGVVATATGTPATSTTASSSSTAATSTRSPSSSSSPPSAQILLFSSSPTHVHRQHKKVLPMRPAYVSASSSSPPHEHVRPSPDSTHAHALCLPLLLLFVFPIIGDRLH